MDSIREIIANSSNSQKRVALALQLQARVVSALLAEAAVEVFDTETGMRASASAVSGFCGFFGCAFAFFFCLEPAVAFALGN